MSSTTLERRSPRRRTPLPFRLVEECYEEPQLLPRHTIKFSLTISWCSIFFVEIAQVHYEFITYETSFGPTMLISFTMISSCHKQRSTAEQQLAE